MKNMSSRRVKVLTSCFIVAPKFFFRLLIRQMTSNKRTALRVKKRVLDTMGKVEF